MLESGQMFERKYVIRELLGSGGFALVYRAHQPDVGRDVAIKILRPAEDIGTHPATLLARFQREAKMAAELRNEHNIQLFDFGRSSGGFLYMIFEYVDGDSLDALIRSAGPIPPRRVIPILEQLLVALSEAHRLGILHRDVKPQNIIIFERLGQKDRAKLIDYGIAKPMTAANAGGGITAEGHVVGTPRYMAPEQILMLGDLTPATDLYSLGLVAYEMLAGKALLGSSTHTEVIKRQLSGEVFRVPPSIPAPPGLRAVVDTMLKKSARDRYQSADECLAALRAVDPDEEVEVIPPVGELLQQLRHDDADDSQTVRGDSPTIDSRPFANSAFTQTGGAEPPTLDSNPNLLRHVLEQDSSERKAVGAGATKRPVIFAVFATLAVVGLVAAGVLALAVSKSRRAKDLVRDVAGVGAAAANPNCPDDPHEPNDRSIQGTPLESGSLEATLCPGNVDWYRLGKYEAGDVVRVAAQYEDGQDDIDLEMYIEADFEVGVWSSKRTESLTRRLSKAGNVSVRLYFPKTTGDHGRAYRVTRDIDSLAKPSSVTSQNDSQVTANPHQN